MINGILVFIKKYVKKITLYENFRENLLLVGMFSVFVKTNNYWRTYAEHDEKSFM